MVETVVTWVCYWQTISKINFPVNSGPYTFKGRIQSNLQTTAKLGDGPFGPYREVDPVSEFIHKGFFIDEKYTMTIRVIDQ